MKLHETEMEIDQEPEEECIVEECSLYKAEGFTTTAMSYNEKLAKICAVRKSDFK